MRKHARKKRGPSPLTHTKRSKSSGFSKKTSVEKLRAAKQSSASERFVKDLLVRGEAAKPDAKGKLPLEATHAITKEDKEGTAEVRRARFKYF